MRSPDQPLRLTLIAPDGRMGRAIAAAASADPGFAIEPDHGDVLVDFSAPAALEASLARARAAAVPILIGTTGLDAEDMAAMRAAAADVPLLYASNTSLGVALLADLAERAARLLGDEWDVEILEAHHRHKADAPSGTALTLGEAVARGRGADLAALREGVRDGVDQSRATGGVGFAALRGGSVVGDHDVMFLGPDERLILSHRAESRALFARGTLAAARFLAAQPPGYYTMRDVVAAA